jgi:hypothetical protein
MEEKEREERRFLVVLPTNRDFRARMRPLINPSSMALV